MQIKIYGQVIKCTKAVQGADFIEVYDGNNLIRRDTEISDFTGYVLTDENGNPAEFTESESGDDKMNAVIRAVVTALAGSGSVAPQAVEGVIGRALEIAHEQIQ